MRTQNSLVWGEHTLSALRLVLPAVCPASLTDTPIVSSLMSRELFLRLNI